MTTFYREPAKDDIPQNYVLPQGNDHEVIFLDHIARMKVYRGSGSDRYSVLYWLTCGTDNYISFSYDSIDEAIKAMKNVVDMKMKWDIYKQKLARTTIINTSGTVSSED